MTAAMAAARAGALAAAACGRYRAVASPARPRALTTQGGRVGRTGTLRPLRRARASGRLRRPCARKRLAVANLRPAGAKMVAPHRRPSTLMTWRTHSLVWCLMMGGQTRRVRASRVLFPLLSRRGSGATPPSASLTPSWLSSTSVVLRTLTPILRAWSSKARWTRRCAGLCSLLGRYLLPRFRSGFARPCRRLCAGRRCRA